MEAVDKNWEFVEAAKAVIEQEKIRCNCWHDFFILGKDPTEGLVRPQILASWGRCRARKMNPYDVRREVVSQEELEALRCKYEFLIQATKPVFEAFAERMGEKVYMLDLYDKDLTFIQSFGNNPRALERRYASVGFRCTESTAGNTAMSLAKETGETAQLIGAEHFDYSLHDEVCTAAPIYNSQGALVGFINMVEFFPTDAYRSFSTIHAISQGIMYSLKLLEQQVELERAMRVNQAIMEAIGDGIMMVDADGVISMTNKAVHRYMNVEGGTTLIGRKVDDLFGKENPFSQVLRSGVNLTEREIRLNTARGALRFVGSICGFGEQDSEVRGVIATFSDFASTQKVMKNLAGWSATMTFEDIVGDSPQIQSVVQLARQTATLPSNTLICGESGTGKEVFAHAIHNESNFANGPFVTVNCAAIPNSLLESELFGYESGAYTGAKRNGQPGKFELAQNGTILLDEINSMPLDMQVKLLRVLQEKAVTRLGGKDKIFLNIKIIAATNTDLQQEVQKGSFRADLFYRLNVLTIRIPPLRERVSDIDQMCRRFLGRLVEAEGGEPRISEGALRILRSYPWPGNVRELENVLERAWIQSKLLGDDGVNERSLWSLPEFSDGRDLQINPRMELPSAETMSRGGEEVSGASLRRKEILDALERNRWNLSNTAKELGIARNTLYRRMKKYDIQE